MLKALKYLKGPQASPLLAPRGVYYHKGVLVVADTANNRVCIWNQEVVDIYQDSDVILGQTNIQETDRNQRTFVSAQSLQYPSGVWTDGERVIVADAWNHRVLIWLKKPTQNGQAADVVLGQPDFLSNIPNQIGLSHNPSAQSLYWCYGVFVYQEKLFIADTGNRRVLVFNQIPTSNNAKADYVIGQPDFNSRDYNPENAIWPYAVKVSEKGELLITDTQYYRTLAWKNWETALYKTADFVLGQPDFSSNGQNQFKFIPEAHTLNWCYDSCFFQSKIVVADTGNSRVLLWNDFPQSNQPVANQVLGQTDFNVIGESSLNIQLFQETALEKMYWPFAVNSYQNLLIVADTGNHRIIFYEI